LLLQKRRLGRMAAIRFAQLQRFGNASRSAIRLAV
jgi:hypothetical protein